jgi:hypothetical protein
MGALLGRCIHVAFPVLVVADILLVRLGIVSLATVALLEGVLLLAAGVQLVRVALRYRRERANGRDISTALEEGFAVLLPRKAARLLALEPRVWLCAARWMLRRRPRGPDVFAYSRNSLAVVVVALTFLSAPVELLLAELLIPWSWLRILLLALGIYGAVWVLGYAGSLSVLPHRLATTGVYLRHGFLAEAYIPYAAIAEVRLEQRASPNGRDGCIIDPNTRTAYLAVGGNTHATLRLRAPQTLRRILMDTLPVTTICIAVDEPQRFTEALAARVTAAGSEALVGSQIMPG